MKKVILFFAIISLPLVVYSLNGDGSSGNPYNGFLTADATFGPGDVFINGTISTYTNTLTILPGTTLHLYSGVDINAEGGRIIAVGTQSALINFTANNVNWGHVYLTSSQQISIFDYCVFEKGSATGSNRGGALYASESSRVQIKNSIFRDNHSADRGGAVAMSFSEVTISDCIFENNSGTIGGTIFINEGCITTIDRCKIFSNHATVKSGGIYYATDAAGTIQNTLIYNNTSPEQGAVSWGGYTGGILANVINCVIANNSPHDVYFRSSGRFSVQNSIIWGSDQSVYFEYEGPLLFNLINCAVQGAYSAAYPSGEVVVEDDFTNSFTLNSSNTAADGPNFISPLTYYNITYNSPCRDKGNDVVCPPTDFLGNGRVGICDIGAYEVQGQHRTWTGGASPEWNDEGNWNSGVPASPDDVSILGGGFIPEITGSVECNNLIIEPSAYLTIESGGTLAVDALLLIQSASTTDNGSMVNFGSVTGKITYNRMMPADRYRYVSSPVSAATLPSGTTFWRWNETLGAWGEDIGETPTTSCSSGLGYTMLTSGSPVSFTGTSVKSASQTGTAPYNSYADHYNDQRTGAGGQWGGGGWNLLGNPFTSAMDALEFIDYNNGISDGSQEDNSFDPSYEALYIYDGSDYTYVAESVPGFPAGIRAFPGSAPYYTDIQVGQGFFVLANYDDVTFSFTPEMQTHNAIVPMTKSARAENDAWPGVQLKVKYGGSERSTLVVYNGEMSTGLDPGYDVGMLNAGPEVEIYTALVEDNGLNFARQALPLANADAIIVPIGIDTEKGGEVTFSAYTVPLGNNKFWLEDRTTGIFTDLSTGTYRVVLPAKSYGTGRFYLKAAGSITGIETPGEEPGSGLRIWTYDGKVIIKGEVTEKAVCSVFDMQGSKIIETQLTDPELNTVEMPSGSKGVYMVRVTDRTRSVTKKIVLL